MAESAHALLRRYERLDPDSFVEHTVTSFDDRFNKLWEEASERHKLLIVRNESYLNWRYIGRPCSNYLILAIEKSSRIEGYIVLATEIRSFAGWKKGYIVDIFAKSEEGIRFLVQLACDHLAKEKADLAICWMMKNQLDYECLVERGFVNDTLSTQKLICRINTSDIAFRKLYQSVEKNWFLTMGDSDNI